MGSDHLPDGYLEAECEGGNAPEYILDMTAVFWCSQSTPNSFYSSFRPAATGSAPWRRRSAPTPASGGGKGSRKAEEDKAIRRTADAVPSWVNTRKRRASRRGVERLGKESITRNDVEEYSSVQCVFTPELMDSLRTTTELELLQRAVCPTELMEVPIGVFAMRIFLQPGPSLHF